MATVLFLLLLVPGALVLMAAGAIVTTMFFAVAHGVRAAVRPVVDQVRSAHPSPVQSGAEALALAPVVVVPAAPKASERAVGKAAAA